MAARRLRTNGYRGTYFAGSLSRFPLCCWQVSIENPAPNVVESEDHSNYSDTLCNKVHCPRAPLSWFCGY